MGEHKRDNSYVFMQTRGDACIVELGMGDTTPQEHKAERQSLANKRRWYVIQVPTGKEATLCSLIQRVAAPGELSECFVPSFETQRKVHGVWETVRAVLFPGYVIAVTCDVVALKHRLRGVLEFTRLLTMGESFVPLDDADRAWLSAFTTAENRTIPMSMGVVEGDHIVVTQGPLMGHEGWIVSVNRRKSLAFIQVEMFGRKIETRIGLGIVRRKPCLSREEQLNTKDVL